MYTLIIIQAHFHRIKHRSAQTTIVDILLTIGMNFLLYHKTYLNTQKCFHKYM